MSKVSLIRKVTMIATMFALALAAFSATNAFAAGSTTTATSSQTVDLNLQKNWKAEGIALKAETAYFDQIDRHVDRISYNNGFESRKDFLDFPIVLSKAEAILKSHVGFDANGKVTDQAQAAKTVKQLSINLNQLRGNLFYRLRNIA